jgi:hypothetical protein
MRFAGSLAAESKLAICGRYFGLRAQNPTKCCRKFMQRPPAPCARSNKLLI